MMRGERRRAFRGYTHDPFDCCGKEAGVHGRAKATICPDCKALIAEGKAARERVPKGLTPRLWTSADYGWPRFYGTGADLPSDAHDALAKAFWRLANLITVPAPADTEPFSPELGEPDYRTGERRNLPWPRLLTVKGQSHDSWSWAKMILVDPDTADTLDALHRAITDALSVVWDRGKERGGSALHGLASGEMSLSDFDDTLAPEAERRRRR